MQAMLKLGAFLHLLGELTCLNTFNLSHFRLY